MAAMNFPSSPSNGDTYTNPDTGVTYTYDGTDAKWKTTVTSNAFLPLSGGTLTGALNVTDIKHPSSGSNNIVLDSSGGVDMDAGTLYVDASNNRVGIGTTSPQVNLDIAPASSSATLRVHARTDTSSVPAIELQRGTATTWGSDVYGDFRIKNEASELIFEYGQSSSTTERARIDSYGRLLVGTSTSLFSDALIQSYKASGPNVLRQESASISNGQTCRLDVIGGTRSGTVGVYKHSGITNPGPYVYLQEEDGGAAFYWTDNSGNFRVSSNSDHIGTTSGTVVGTQTSDERIKNILGPVEYGLDTLKQIEPVRYSLKSQPDIEQLGFIAQQVLPLVPQSVFDTKEHIEGEPEDAPTKLGMEYVALIPVLVNAIKELSAEVDALKAQLS